jgi:hypothetical protein
MYLRRQDLRKGSKKAIIKVEEPEKVAYKVTPHIKRYVAVIVNPMGAKLYHGPSLDFKQQGLLRKNQSVHILAECEDFGQLSVEPPRWIMLSDVEPYNKPFKLVDPRRKGN